MSRITLGHLRRLVVDFEICNSKNRSHCHTQESNSAKISDKKKLNICEILLLLHRNYNKFQPNI